MCADTKNVSKLWNSKGVVKFPIFSCAVEIMQLPLAFEMSSVTLLISLGVMRWGAGMCLGFTVD